MKIIVEAKNDASACVAHDLGKAIAVKSENLKHVGELLTIETEARTYSYTDKDCNFFRVELSADFTVHKTPATIPQIVAAYVAEP